VVDNCWLRQLLPASYRGCQGSVTELSTLDLWWTNKYCVRIHSSQFFYCCLVVILLLFHTKIPFQGLVRSVYPLEASVQKERGVTSLQMRIKLSPHPVSILSSAVIVIKGVHLTIWIMSWGGTAEYLEFESHHRQRCFSSGCISLRLSPSALFNGYRWIASIKSLSFCVTAFKASLTNCTDSVEYTLVS